jgi:hypothetical protein
MLGLKSLERIFFKNVKKGKSVPQSHYRPEVPGGFQGVKVPR